MSIYFNGDAIFGKELTVYGDNRTPETETPIHPLVVQIAALEGLVLDEHQIVTHDANSLGLIGKKFDPLNNWEQGGNIIERHNQALVHDWLSDDTFILGFVVNNQDTILQAALQAIVGHYHQDN